MQRRRNAKPTKIDPVEKAKECQTKAERQETKKKEYQTKPDRSDGEEEGNVKPILEGQSQGINTADPHTVKKG
jgi:hypothetical protein